MAEFAPILVLPDVITPEHCDQIITYYRDRCGGGTPSGVLHYQDGQPEFRLDPAVKMRREAVITDRSIEAALHARVAESVLPEIRRAFQYTVTGREPFKIISYEGGQGYFRAHRDNETPDVMYRRFAMSLNLNTGDYSGGDLRFPEFGDRLYSVPKGGALVFSCSLLHEVSPITAGERFAATTFFFGSR